MTIGEFMKKCWTGFDQIFIQDQTSGDGVSFESKNDIPKEYYDIEILHFDFGGYVSTDHQGLDFVLYIEI